MLRQSLMTDSGSVQWTSRTSPDDTDVSALRVLSAGIGQRKPVRSSLIMAMRWTLQQVRVAEEPNAVAGRDLDRTFIEFDKPVGLDQG
jgi:hypothetical protein